MGLEWEENHESLSQPGRWLLVGDGNIGYVAQLPEGMTVATALVDFEDGYEGGPLDHVFWQLYEDGIQTRSGNHSYAV